jgi:hypothetical protein
LWCCIQNQIFVIHVFFNVWNGTMMSYYHILLLNVCMNLDFFLITIDNHEIFLWFSKVDTLEIIMMQVTSTWSFEM